MYKNLNTSALGISGRQSELIELALTYGFRGLDLDMGDVVKRVRARGLDNARRFVESAKIQVGGFELPIPWQGDRPSFVSGLVELKETAEIASALGATNCVAVVEPASANQPYHENFELHRTRFAEIADVLGELGIKLGLTFRAASPHREGCEYPFIHQAEALLTLLKTVASSNIGLALDTWDWYVGGGAMDQLRDVPCEQITCVRLADTSASVDLSKITDNERCMPSEGGLVDCTGIIHHLAEIHYTGPITLYPHPAQFAGMTRDAIVQKASSVLDHLWKSAGLNRSGALEAVPVEAD